MSVTDRSWVAKTPRSFSSCEAMLGGVRRRVLVVEKPFRDDCETGMEKSEALSMVMIEGDMTKESQAVSRLNGYACRRRVRTKINSVVGLSYR